MRVPQKAHRSHVEKIGPFTQITCYTIPGSGGKARHQKVSHKGKVRWVREGCYNDK